MFNTSNNLTRPDLATSLQILEVRRQVVEKFLKSYRTRKVHYRLHKTRPPGPIVIKLKKKNRTLTACVVKATLALVPTYASASQAVCFFHVLKTNIL